MFRGYRFQLNMGLLEKDVLDMAIAADYCEPADAFDLWDWPHYAEWAERALKAGGRDIPVELRLLLVRFSAGGPFTAAEILDAADLLARVRGNRSWQEVRLGLRYGLFWRR